MVKHNTDGTEEDSYYGYNKETGIEPIEIAIESESQFIKEWNKIENARYVGLYFHSNSSTLYINTDNDEYMTVNWSGKTGSGKEATPIGTLGRKSIDKLYLYACNSGHLNHLDNNLAVTFSKYNDIKSVYAWDGSMKWSKDGEHTRLAFNQHYFVTHLPDVYYSYDHARRPYRMPENYRKRHRKPEGMLRFYKDSSDKIQYNSVQPVGTEFQLINFDLWQTAGR